MVFKNGVIGIQAAGYNGAGTVFDFYNLANGKWHLFGCSIHYLFLEYATNHTKKMETMTRLMPFYKRG